VHDPTPVVGRLPDPSAAGPSTNAGIASAAITPPVIHSFRFDGFSFPTDSLRAIMKSSRQESAMAAWIAGGRYLRMVRARPAVSNSLRQTLSKLWHGIHLTFARHYWRFFSKF
jgi:hypothetical protein